MKKLVLEITVITAIVVYLTVHITYMLREPTIEKTNLMGFYAEPENTLDIVFIGSSTLRSSINPLVLWENYGITSYDIATSSQRPSGIIWLLKEALKTQKEAIYIIDVNNMRLDEEVWDEQNEGSIRHITDGLKYSSIRVGCINDIVKDEKISYYFDIIKYHNNIKNGLDFREWNYECRNPYKGFNMLTDTTVSAPIYYCSDQKDGRISEYGERVLRELLSYCKTQGGGGVKAEFIISEQHAIDYATCQCIKNIIEEYGYSCYIFSEYENEMKMDSLSDFYDDLHTNVLGSEKCSLFFGKYLTGKYLFQEKNSDLINDWNQCYAEMKGMLEDAKNRTLEESQKKLEDMQIGINK